MRFGQIGSLIAFEPVHVRLCGASTALALGGGRHRLLAARPGAFAVTSLSLVHAGSAGLPGAAPVQILGTAAQHRPGAAGTARSVRVRAWQPEYRQVSVGPGAASYLELHQNANAGWVATMNGRTLRPVQLDGWQQGFVVPAGKGGVVTLTFKPVKFYHVWIILSAAGALGLLAVAFAGRKRDRAREQRERVREERGRVRELMDRPSHAVLAAGAPQRWRTTWLGLTALAAAMAIAGGPVALAVPVVAVLARRWPSWFGGLAAAGMVTAGVLTALATHPALQGTGAFGAPAQAAALVALTCALMPVLPQRRARGRAGGWAAGP